MSDLSFRDRVVVVTGAGGALGREYALEIARRGGAVVVNDLGGTVEGRENSRDMADSVVSDIRSAGGRAIANYDSVATMDGARRIVSCAVHEFGRLDALINNAGNFRHAGFEEVRGDDLSSLIESHLVGTFNVTQAAWPVMKARGYGRIVFTTSSAGMLGTARLSAYGSAKGGITGLMNVLSQEGQPHGILCNGLMPNAISRMGLSFAGGSERREKPGKPQRPEIMKTLQPAFNVGIAVYLASEACTTTHSIYSSLGGRIARVFIGVTDGWRGPLEAPPTAEQIAENIAQIRDAKGFSIPESQTDEQEIVVRQLAGKS